MSHDPSSPAPLPSSRSGCSIETAFAVLGGRWKAVVLYWLLKDKRRFGELRRLLHNCTQRVLTVQLRELESDGLVTRTVFPAVPPHVEYALTPLGRTLEPLLRSLAEWGLLYQTQRTAQPISAEVLAHCAD